MCRRWRSFKTLQNAQVTVIRAWLTNYRRKSIDKRKELEAALKEHKDKKPKAKAGKKVQVSRAIIALLVAKDLHGICMAWHHSDYSHCRLRFPKIPALHIIVDRWTPCGSSWRRAWRSCRSLTPSRRTSWCWARPVRFNSILIPF